MTLGILSGFERHIRHMYIVETFPMKAKHCNCEWDVHVYRVLPTTQHTVRYYITMVANFGLIVRVGLDSQWKLLRQV